VTPDPLRRLSRRCDPYRALAMFGVILYAIVFAVLVT
jgi:hypothetical protein